MKIAMQDRFVIGLNFSRQPVAKRRILNNWGLSMMIGNDQQ
jgi:hypothetical protein